VGTLSASAILAIRKGYAAGKGHAAATEPSILTASQRAIVSGVIDVMIPRTDTPGAVDVGVPGFIDLMLRDVLHPGRSRSLSCRTG